MAREADVALLMTASDSFDDEHKLAHIQKKICAHKVSKAKAFFMFRDHYAFETKIEKSESITISFTFLINTKVCSRTNFCTHIATQLKTRGNIVWFSRKYI